MNENKEKKSRCIVKSGLRVCSCRTRDVGVRAQCLDLTKSRDGASRFDIPVEVGVDFREPIIHPDVRSSLDDCETSLSRYNPHQG